MGKFHLTHAYNLRPLRISFIFSGVISSSSSVFQRSALQISARLWTPMITASFSSIANFRRLWGPRCALAVRLALGGVGEEGAHGLGLAHGQGGKFLCESIPGLLGIDGQTAVQVHGDVEGIPSSLRSWAG